MTEKEMSIEDQLAAEAEELDGYFSDTPLDPKPVYPPLKKSFDNVIIVSNLPIVPEAKIDKLTKVVIKLVSRIGTLVVPEGSDSGGVFMPFDSAKGSTLGFAFAEYESPEDAQNAIGVLNGYQFDKKHNISTTPYTRAEELRELKETEFVEPAPTPFVEKPNPMSWLEDPSQRDQFVIRRGKETEVYWFDSQNEPVIDYDGSREKEAGVAVGELIPLLQ